MVKNTQPSLVYVRAKLKLAMEAQRCFIEQQAEGSGYQIVGTFSNTSTAQDNPWSRPGLMHLLKTLEDNPGISDVIVDCRTRFSRRVKQARQIAEKLESINVRVHYSEDGHGSNSVNAQLLRFIRHEERVKHGERVRRGKRLKLLS